MSVRIGKPSFGTLPMAAPIVNACSTAMSATVIAPTDLSAARSSSGSRVGSMIRKTVSAMSTRLQAPSPPVRAKKSVVQASVLRVRLTGAAGRPDAGIVGDATDPVSALVDYGRPAITTTRMTNPMRWWATVVANRAGERQPRRPKAGGEGRCWRVLPRGRGVRGASLDQFRRPLPETLEVVGVVVAAGLLEPPDDLVGRVVIQPFVEHAGSAGVRLDPGHLPGLPLHRRQEPGVERVDVDAVTLVGPRGHALELRLRLGEPRPEVGHEITDGPVRVPVVARRHAFLRRERADELGELVPAGPFRLEVPGHRIQLRTGGGRGRGHRAATNEPSSGRPASSQSSSPPE